MMSIQRQSPVSCNWIKFHLFILLSALAISANAESDASLASFVELPQLGGCGDRRVNSRTCMSISKWTIEAVRPGDQIVGNFVLFGGHTLRFQLDPQAKKELVRRFISLNNEFGRYNLSASLLSNTAGATCPLILSIDQAPQLRLETFGQWKCDDSPLLETDDSRICTWSQTGTGSVVELFDAMKTDWKDEADRGSTEIIANRKSGSNLGMFNFIDFRPDILPIGCVSLLTQKVYDALRALSQTTLPNLRGLAIKMPPGVPCKSFNMEASTSFNGKTYPTSKYLLSLNESLYDSTPHVSSKTLHLSLAANFNVDFKLPDRLKAKRISWPILLKEAHIDSPGFPDLRFSDQVIDVMSPLKEAFTVIINGRVPDDSMSEYFMTNREDVLMLLDEKYIYRHTRPPSNSAMTECSSSKTWFYFRYDNKPDPALCCSSENTVVGFCDEKGKPPRMWSKSKTDAGRLDRLSLEHFRQISGLVICPGDPITTSNQCDYQDRNPSDPSKRIWLGIARDRAELDGITLVVSQQGHEQR